MVVEAKTVEERAEDERIRQLASLVLEEVASSLDDEQRRAAWKAFFQRALPRADRSISRGSSSPDRSDAAQPEDCIRLCEGAAWNRSVTLRLQAAGSVEQCARSTSRISSVKASFLDIWAGVTDPGQGETLRLAMECRNAAMHSASPSKVGWVRLANRLRDAFQHRPPVGKTPDKTAGSQV